MSSVVSYSFHPMDFSPPTGNICVFFLRVTQYAWCLFNDEKEYRGWSLPSVSRVVKRLSG